MIGAWLSDCPELGAGAGEVTGAEGAIWLDEDHAIPPAPSAVPKSSAAPKAIAARVGFEFVIGGYSFAFYWLRFEHGQRQRLG